MTRIAIASPAIVSGDAIGHDVLHMSRVLAERGHQVELFSTTWGRAEPRNDNGLHIRAYLKGDPSTVLILHHAIGWRHALPLIVESRCRRIVKYHNVTPAHFYDNLDDDYANLCRQGRAQLHRIIASNCDLYLADSPFNGEELRALGAPPDRCVVVPPFNAVAELLKTPADAEIVRDYGDGRTNVLFVGRRAPNKGHRLLLDAFALYHQRHNCNSRLVLVGKGDAKQAAYTEDLSRQIRRLGLNGHVVFIDSATEAELKAYYQCASAFAVASEHEGFCVPLIEAMALQIPIVAYGAMAVADTLGDAGLIWDEPDPFLLAQSLDVVVREDGVRRRLLERGWQRYHSHFANERIEDAFLHALRPFLAK